MEFRTGSELLALCRREGVAISEVMLRRETEVIGAVRAASQDAMRHSWEIMKSSVHEAIESPGRSMGGLLGGEANRMNARIQSGDAICGNVCSKASAYAMAVLEVNASMGLIVAAPTAGSSGVIPGSFLAVQEEFGFSDEQMVTALFHAAAVGYLITRNATVAGAQGGCQAEIGSASAMAASAIAELMGAPPEACLSAASSALSNLMGLVCDPIAGLVEAPCQKRNAVGAANALICAEIALSGIREHVPFDEMVGAMYQVGRRLPMELRETSLGGAAATPTACALCEQIFSE